jgi:hypothetical protein
MALPPRRAAAALAFLAILGSAVPHREPAPPDPFLVRRQKLIRFAAALRARLPARTTVVFILPPSEGDGGLINHRLRYVLPGRFIRTNQDRGTAPETHPSDVTVRWP